MLLNLLVVFQLCFACSVDVQRSPAPDIVQCRRQPSPLATHMTKETLLQSVSHWHTRFWYEYAPKQRIQEFLWRVWKFSSGSFVLPGVSIIWLLSWGVWGKRQYLLCIYLMSMEEHIIFLDWLFLALVKFSCSSALVVRGSYRIDAYWYYLIFSQLTNIIFISFPPFLLQVTLIMVFYHNSNPN